MRGVKRLLIMPLALLCVFFHGCGLPTITTALKPPDEQPILATPATPTFTINNTIANIESEFRGFELYYKFYSDQTQIEDDLQNANVTEGILRSTYHFLPVCSQLDTFSGTPPTNLHSNKPLLFVQLVDKGTVFSITVTFPSITSPYSPPVVNYGGSAGFTSLSIRRNVGDTNYLSSTYQQPKPFIPETAGTQPAYQSTDIDIQAIWTAVQPLPFGNGTVYCAMYALSYGLVDFTNPVYSTPVYLGYVQINTNQ